MYFMAQSICNNDFLLFALTTILHFTNAKPFVTIISQGIQFTKQCHSNEHCTKTKVIMKQAIRWRDACKKKTQQLSVNNESVISRFLTYRSMAELTVKYEDDFWKKDQERIPAYMGLQPGWREIQAFSLPSKWKGKMLHAVPTPTHWEPSWQS